jgi:hypothetical protein
MFRNYILWRAWNDNKKFFDEEKASGGYDVYAKHGVDPGKNPFNKLNGDNGLNSNDLRLIRRLYLKEWSDPTYTEYPNRQIKSLDGIQGFTGLEELYVSGHDIETLDVSGMPNLRVLRVQNQRTKLKYLKMDNCPELWQVYAQGNDLKGLDLSNTPKLGQLVINNNRNIGQIDVTKCPELFWFDCFNCMQPAIDVTQNPKLETLYCYETRDNEYDDDATYINSAGTISTGESSRATIDGDGTTRRGNINELDLRYNPKLKELRCSNNPLKNLDLSRNPNLEILYVNSIDMKEDNNLQQNLDILPKLKRLSCYNANLDNLDVSKSPDLWELVCYKNNLKHLDLSKNTALTYLSIGEAQPGKDLNNARNPNGGNLIRSIDLRNNLNLETLHCCKMQLTNLDLTGLTKLTDLDYQIQIREIEAEHATLRQKQGNDIITKNLYYLRMDNNLDGSINNESMLNSRIAVTEWPVEGGEEPTSNFDISLVDMTSWTNGTVIQGGRGKESSGAPRRIVATRDDIPMKDGKYDVFGDILVLDNVTETETSATGAVTYRYNVKLPDGSAATDAKSDFTLLWYSNQQVITGVDNVNAAGSIDSVEYINAQGMRSSQPWSGLNIVVTRYSNGTATTAKQMF